MAEKAVCQPAIQLANKPSWQPLGKTVKHFTKPGEARTVLLQALLPNISVKINTHNGETSNLVMLTFTGSAIWLIWIIFVVLIKKYLLNGSHFSKKKRKKSHQGIHHVAERAIYIQIVVKLIKQYTLKTRNSKMISITFDKKKMMRPVLKFIGLKFHFLNHLNNNNLSNKHVFFWFIWAFPALTFFTNKTTPTIIVLNIVLCQKLLWTIFSYLKRGKLWINVCFCRSLCVFLYIIIELWFLRIIYKWVQHMPWWYEQKK